MILQQNSKMFISKSKDIHIYAKTFREIYIKKYRKKKKELTTIQVVGKLASLMSTQVTIEKYVDP